MFRKIIITIFLFSFYIQAGYSQSSEILYLSGKDNDNAVDWDFYISAGRQSGYWTRIPVPSCWELKGFGTYNYGKDDNPADETGHYKYTFRLPESWTHKIIEIVLEGVMTDAQVLINGQSAGEKHQGAFYRFKYDVTSLLNFGSLNLLEVIVDKRSSNESVNRAERDADYWIFGGIFRPVYLQAHPSQFIESTAISADSDGSFAVDVVFNHVKKASVLSCTIKNPGGEIIAPAFSKNVSAGQNKFRLQSHIKNPLLWSAEKPNLCQAEIEIIQDKKVIHRVIKKFGFRTVEVKTGQGIFINGQKVTLKGVNRHSSWPETGKTLSKKLSIIDVNLIKDMNMNAVRMSHYPPDAHFLDVCDSLGLYVLNELGGWQQSYDTDVGKKLVREMVRRDVNHPSIIFWDNGNEGGWNFNLDDEFAKYDPQNRQVLHPWATHVGINTAHYLTYDMYKKLAAGPDILLPTEIWHGLYDGGHAAGLQDFWNLMRREPLIAGFFLWVLADEGVLRTDKNNIIDVNGNSAPDGIVGPHREKEGSYNAIKEIISSVQLSVIQIENFNAKLDLKNLYDFTSLDECLLSYQWINFPSPFKDEAGEKVTRKNQLHLPAIKPHTGGTLKLDLPEDYQNFDALNIKISDPYGREIFSRTFPMKKAEDFVKKYVTANSGKIEASLNDNVIEVRTRSESFRFDKTNGHLLNVLKKGEEIPFGEGPRLVSGKTRKPLVKHNTQGDDYIIDVIFNDVNFNNFRWTVLANGWLKLDYTYTLYGYFDYMGITFNYPESEVTGMRWLGEGPYRVWKNRPKGAELNVWSNHYNNSITGVTWQYPEFKGYYANLHWLVIETKEMPVTILSGTDSLFFRMFTPENGPSPRDAFFSFPDGNISFLHGIAPVGTKFLKAENTGPLGSKNHAQGVYNGVLYFYFGDRY